MFPELPRNVRSKIIEHVVSDNHNEYCLLNKEWFLTSAGQFMELDSMELCGRASPSKWLRLTESLVFSWYSFLNWDFLLSCTRIKSITFRLADNMIFDWDKLNYFLEKCHVKTVYFQLDSEEIPRVFFSFIKGFSHKIQKLEVNGHGLYYDEMLNFDYSNLIEFKTHTLDNPICFDKISQSMPKLEHLKLEADNFQHSPSNFMTFSFLKTLDIFLEEYEKELHAGFIEKLFRCNFPVLLSCVLYLPVHKGSLDRIPQCMPKLRHFSSDLPLNEENRLTFPTCTLPFLDDLDLHCFDDNDSKFFIQYNLKHLPQLQKLTTRSNFSIIDPDNDDNPVLSLIDNKVVFHLSTKVIADHLFNLNEIEFSCDTHVSTNELLKLCKVVPKLTLEYIEWLDPLAPIPIGPFKTTHLTLHGSDFLTNELICWLAGQSQLKTLNLKLFKFTKFNLEQVFFPYIQNLSIDCNSPKKKSYLESIFNYDKLNLSRNNPLENLMSILDSI